MRLADIDLRLLRIFKTVAECGGIVKAQEALGINQPTISGHIGNLEKRLDVTLCHRGRQGFSLTPVGEIVLSETAKLLEYMENYTTRLSEIGRDSDRRIRIGMVDCLATDPACPMHAAIRKTQSAIGDLDLDLVVSDYFDLLADLRARRLDLAVLGFDDVIPDGIEAVHLYDEISRLYCHKDHPCAQSKTGKTLEEQLARSRISAQSFIPDATFSNLGETLRDIGQNVAIGQIEATAHLVLSGTHVGLMPAHFAQAWVSTGEIVELALDKYQLVSRIHLAHMRNQAPNRAAAVLVKALMA